MDTLQEQRPDVDQGVKVAEPPELVNEVCPRCTRTEVIAIKVDGKSVLCCNLCGEQFTPAKRTPSKKRAVERKRAHRKTANRASRKRSRAAAKPAPKRASRAKAAPKTPPAPPAAEASTPTKGATDDA
jgi:ribosome-binding protein aMBF1 (putative translation factor)